MEKKTSIIVPIYNAEKYLAKCLDSIIEQTYSNLEVILINDGSKDGSLAICELYSERDARIKVIDRQNAGVSATRNHGINIATGDYILFIDADDYVDKNMVSKLVQAKELNNADMSMCGYRVIGSNSVGNDINLLKNLSKVVDGKILLEYMISISTSRVFGYIWRCLFDKKCLMNNNTYFAVDIKMAEDYVFLLQYINQIKSSAIVPEQLYVYRINDNSTTRSYMPSQHNDQYRINKWILENICTKYPSTKSGYFGCSSETYLCTIQNICRKNTPYSVLGRIKECYKIKYQYNYNQDIKKLMRNLKSLSLKRKISYISLYMNLDLIYITLLSLRNKLKQIKN